MIAAEWNFLSAGDLVVVHDPPFPPTSPVPGEVVRIVRRRRVNEVAIRLGDHRLVWPALTTVHRAPVPGGPTCWRCRDADDSESWTDLPVSTPPPRHLRSV